MNGTESSFGVFERTIDSYLYNVSTAYDRFGKPPIILECIIDMKEIGRLITDPETSTIKRLDGIKRMNEMLKRTDATVREAQSQYERLNRFIKKGYDPPASKLIDTR